MDPRIWSRGDPAKPLILLVESDFGWAVGAFLNSLRSNLKKRLVTFSKMLGTFPQTLTTIQRELHGQIFGGNVFAQTLLVVALHF